MPKAKKPKMSAEDRILSTIPWSCTNFGKQSEIEVQMPLTGKWETIATTHTIEGFDAEDVAALIVHAVIDRQKTKKFLREMIAPLDSCREDQGMNHKTRKSIEHILEQAKGIM